MGVLQALLERDVNAQHGSTSNGMMALHYAAENGQEKATLLLSPIKPSCDFCHHLRETALMKGAWDGHARAVQELLEIGADLSLKGGRPIVLERM